MESGLVGGCQAEVGTSSTVVVPVPVPDMREPCHTAR